MDYYCKTKTKQKISLPVPFEAEKSCSMSLLIISKLPENSCLTFDVIFYVVGDCNCVEIIMSGS